ncbi:Isoflavone reductase-like protein [Nymphaea thermarum]|nr:Isoflavone reductase-like protein [Nymphaea thermarum]
MEKSRVLIVGGSGYIGRGLVKASLALGHPTYVLQRPDIGLDIEKIQILLDFKQQGARLVEASFSDHRSLVEAVKLVDVVVCALSGVHHRSHSILMQLKLVDAAKEAGNIKRFVPSEYGIDPARMADALSPGRNTFDEKMVVSKSIEDAGIPHTYVSANCFAGYFVGGLCQLKPLIPTRDRVHLHGDGTVFVDEDDVGTYTIKSVDDPRALNKTLYIRPPQNVMSQMELVKKWEKLIGKQLEKISISEEEFLASKKGNTVQNQLHFCSSHDYLNKYN